MKKILFTVLIALIIPLQACAQEKWQEGTNYTIVAEEATAKPEVLEFFSYWCQAAVETRSDDPGPFKVCGSSS